MKKLPGERRNTLFKLQMIKGAAIPLINFFLSFFSQWVSYLRLNAF